MSGFVLFRNDKKKIYIYENKKKYELHSGVQLNRVHIQYVQ